MPCRMTSSLTLVMEPKAPYVLTKRLLGENMLYQVSLSMHTYIAYTHIYAAMYYMCSVRLLVQAMTPR